MSPKFVDLFSGIGGFSCGLERAGYSCVAAVEADPDVASTFADNHPGLDSAAMFSEDVKGVSAARLLDTIGMDAGDLDLLVGGPPCQGFSTIGKRHHADDRNLLVFEFLRLVRGVRPKVFVMENVPGMLTFNGGKTADEIVSLARDAGYSNTRIVRVDATTCGVPQKRTRVLIYGSRRCQLPDLGDGLQVLPPATVRDALADLPDPWATLSTYERGAAVPYGGGPSAYSRLLRGGARLVTRWEPVVHTDSIQQGYAQTGPGQIDEKTKCYRLVASQPARTLRAGCKGRTACRPIHPLEHRVITVREAARLQSFPDKYVLPKTTSGAHRGIGNAVPPLLAQTIGERLSGAWS